MFLADVSYIFSKIKLGPNFSGRGFGNRKETMAIAIRFTLKPFGDV